MSFVCSHSNHLVPSCSQCIHLTPHKLVTMEVYVIIIILFTIINVWCFSFSLHKCSLLIIILFLHYTMAITCTTSNTLTIFTIHNLFIIRYVCMQTEFKYAIITELLHTVNKDDVWQIISAWLAILPHWAFRTWSALLLCNVVFCGENFWRN